MDNIAATVGKDLARLRGSQKQAELAARLGVDPSRISRIERGEVTQSSEDLRGYLDAIGTDEAAKYWKHLERRWAIKLPPDFWHPQREELARADRVLVRLDEFVNERAVEGPILAHFNLHRESLLRAVEFLQRVEHGLVFVGDIAVGKSTAISVLSNLLILDDSGGEQDLGRKVVLETNTGGATICEVRVKYRPGDSYGILIQPQSLDEIFNAVRDLCDGILGVNQSYGPEASEMSETQASGRGVPVEINRALRNMAGLARTRRQSADGKFVTIDPAAELAKELGSRERFMAEFFARLRLPERTQTELWHDPTSTSSGFRWLKDTFTLVNNGRTTDVSLPKRIDILVPRPLFDHAHYAIEIIDTKGVDGTAIRPDIEAYVDDERMLVILCSRYGSAPDPTIQGLLEHLKARGADARLKDGVLLMVLVHSREAFGTKGDSGDLASTAEEAYAIKLDQVEAKLADVGANGLSIAFFNAVSDDPPSVANKLLETLDEMRRARVQQIDEIEASVERLIDNYEEAQVQAAGNEVRRQLSIFLGSYGLLPPRTRAPHQALVEAVGVAHPRTVWATTRRKGTWANLDAYHFIGAGTAIDARARASRAISRLRAIIEQMLHDEQLASARDLLNEIKRSSDHWFTEFLSDMTVAGREIYRASLYADDSIWRECTDLYGQGRRYRTAVAEKLREWCEAPNQVNLLTAIEENLTRAWNDRMIQRLRALAIQTDT